MPFFEAMDGAELYYTDAGAGQPVVLIHGWPFNSDMWEKQATWLAENGFRVIAYDRRGFGRSEQTWEGYDYNSLATDLKSLLDVEHLLVDLLGGHASAEHGGGGQVAAVAGVGGAHHVLRAARVGKSQDQVGHANIVGVHLARSTGNFSPWHPTSAG